MISPRLIRARDAPEYCGMGRTVFEREVRPYLTVIPVGRDGIAFDRLDLDGYQYLHATRADLLRRLGRGDDARDAYERALSLAHAEPEVRFLRRRHLRKLRPNRRSKAAR